MPSRRSHRKSRNGCTPCKARRVKCDERRPECSNCLSRKTPCAYAPSLDTEGVLSDTCSSQNAARTRFPRKQYNFPPPELMVYSRALPEASQLNLEDMELLHHWCTATYATMAHNKLTENVYQDLLPKEGLVYPFVLHGLLALSAFHIARSRDENLDSQYFSIALKHHNRALSLFRPVVLSINRENSHIIFAFSSIILQIAFAVSPCSPLAESYDPLRDLIQAFTLCEGLRQVIGASWDWVKEGKLAKVLLDVDDSKDTPLPNAIQAAISHLESLNRYRRSVTSSEDADCYGSAIDKLKELMEIYQGKPCRVDIAMRWPFGLDPRYLDLLREHDQMALVVLAHYCLILHDFRNYWWIEGWSSHLASQIWELLDDDWKPSASWVLKEVGLLV